MSMDDLDTIMGNKYARQSTKPAPHTDGLEWLRDIRARIQREIGTTPQERATYYQEREKSLRPRLYRPAARMLHEEEPSCVLREEPSKK